MNKKCIMCGKEFFKLYYCSLKRWDKRKFCSVVCSNKFGTNILSNVWKKIDIKEEDDCWNWMGYLTCREYGSWMISNKSYLAHRLVYENIYGSIPTGLFVCHRCDNPSCCNPNHLFLGTNSDNVADKVFKGRQSFKLSKEDIFEIIFMYSSGNYSQKELGKMFGVSQSAICKRMKKHDNNT